MNINNRNQILPPSARLLGGLLSCLLAVAQAVPCVAAPVRDIRPGAIGGVELNTIHAVLDGTLYFVANDGTTGIELWRSDGTENGTYLLKDINSVGLHSRPRHLTVSGDLLFFQADDGVNGVELWVTDGTTNGTVLVDNLVFGSGDANPLNLTDWNGTLYFTVSNELWRSDGTSGGTEQVWVGPGSFTNGVGLVPVGGELFFAFHDSFAAERHGAELWKTDGTDVGTVLVVDLDPGISGSDPRHLTRYGDQLVFSAAGYDGLDYVGREPFVTDGTEQGTVLLKDINEGTAGSLTTVPGPDFTESGGLLFFAADDGGFGNELWSSDGTTGGTFHREDTYLGPTSGNPTEIIATDSQLFWRARTFQERECEPEEVTGECEDGFDVPRDFGNELWTLGGSVDGYRFPNHGSVNVLDLITDGRAVYFAASGDVMTGEDTYANVGPELWRSTGQSDLVADFIPGPQGIGAQPLAAMSGAVFFTGDDGVSGRELYWIDALPPAVRDVAVSPNPATANVDVTVTARADDTDSGGSNIFRARYYLDGALVGDMDAVDGAFDSPIEDVTAVISGVAVTPGDHEICVTATDSSGNQSRLVCVDLTVAVAPPDLLVKCTHSPIWPQSGDTVTIQVDAFDGLDGDDEPLQGIPATKVVDTLEIWVDDRTVPAFTATGASTASFTTGTFDEDGTFAYGCRLQDDANGADEAVFSGWRLSAIGDGEEFSAIRGVPLIYNRIFSEAVDVVFIPDSNSYTDSNDAAFLEDIEGSIREGFYEHGLHLRNQHRLNFWLGRDLGGASRATGKCVLTEPADWGSRYAYAEVGAILHAHCMRDCATRNRLFSVEGANSPNVPCPGGTGTPDIVIRHEAGHRPFGLSDEYCCNGGYYEPDPLPNVYTSLENCQADAPNLGRTNADCREFTETESRGGDTFAISDPSTNDLMAANGEPQGADVRRIQWMYDRCDNGDCGGGPRCKIIGITPSCIPSSNLTLGRPTRRASLPIDPTTEEVPNFVVPILERGLAIDVQFDTATDATLVDTYVTATDSPADIGNPPLMQVDCLDADGTVLYEFTDWHPLWLHEEGESGDEELVIVESAEKTFIAPFHPLLDAIRITDIELDVEVLLADVGDAVRDFCTANPMEPTCQLPTTTTTMPTGGVCGDPIDPGALVAGPRAVTATDALFALQAAVGLIGCELCICDVNNSTTITASDALAILAAAVGQAVTLTCPACS